MLVLNKHEKKMPKKITRTILLLLWDSTVNRTLNRLLEVHVPPSQITFSSFRLSFLRSLLFDLTLIQSGPA